MEALERIITTKEDIYEAMNITENLAVKNDFPLTCIMKLRLVTEEACTNAYEHREENRQRHFVIRWKVTADCMEIGVRQQGKVFPLVRKQDVNKSTRGRGIQLILHLMDDVTLCENGEEIELLMRKEKEV